MDFLLRYLPILIAVLVVVVILLIGYVKAPPDQAYIISGLRKNSRILIGQAGIRIPFLERLDKLYLGQMTVDIKTEQSVPTNDFINVSVDAVAKVRISPEEKGIRLAAKNFLNKKGADIALDLRDSLQGNMREIIGTLTLEKINTDRDSFSDQVMQKASKDMEKLGIDILSCNIQNVTDEHGLIQDLGMDNTAKIRKDASIAKAEADLRTLMRIPENYKVLFLQGGASMQFAQVPLNLLSGYKTGKADYINSGNFANLAIKEAKKYADVKEVASSKDIGYTQIPDRKSVV